MQFHRNSLNAVQNRCLKILLNPFLHVLIFPTFMISMGDFIPRVVILLYVIGCQLWLKKFFLKLPFQDYQGKQKYFRVTQL